VAALETRGEEGRRSLVAAVERKAEALQVARALEGKADRGALAEERGELLEALRSKAEASDVAALTEVVEAMRRQILVGEKRGIVVCVCVFVLFCFVSFCCLFVCLFRLFVWLFGCLVVWLFSGGLRGIAWKQLLIADGTLIRFDSIFSGLRAGNGAAAGRGRGRGAEVRGMCMKEERVGGGGSVGVCVWGVDDRATQVMMMSPC
jgi:hypothetical protein